MTWQAQRGDTVLAGEERAVFRGAILQILDSILDAPEDEDAYVHGGARVFNSMTRTQQAASIEGVAIALFQDSDECYPLTAWSESTLATILAQIKCQLMLEIELDEDAKLRSFFRNVMSESIDLLGEAWVSIFELYEEQFLWDLDYESQMTLDAPPEVSALVRERMGVDDAYHTSIPPDLDDDWELTDCYHRVLLVIDGSKKISMQVTILAEVPASMEIKNDDEWGIHIAGFFPMVDLLRIQEKTAVESDNQIVEIWFGGLKVDHTIKELDPPN